MLRKILLLLSLLFCLGSVFAAPWDFLRGPTELASLISPVVVWVLFALALVVMIISLLALKKTGSKRVMIVSMAFILFFVKSILNLVDLYFSQGFFMNFAVQGIFDLVIIACLFAALLWRK